MSEPNPRKKLRPSGGYRETVSFQTSTLIYDATVWFCEMFLDSRSRTVDQMVQAARSGRQKIEEGSRAAATSSQTELGLVNVVRASFEELLLDYEDYLRHRRLPQWAMASPEASAVRRVPQVFICLIHQANLLLGRQIAALERAFVRMAGIADLKKIPECPLCGGQMALRTAKTGPNSGQQFRGCTYYPECKGTQKI